VCSVAHTPEKQEGKKKRVKKNRVKKKRLPHILGSALECCSHSALYFKKGGRGEEVYLMY
jgi:hypothetical protein